MINTIWKVFTSIEILIITISVIILLIIIKPNKIFIRFLKRKRKDCIKEPEKEKKKESRKLGKIIVSDSTYDVLMEIKKKRE